MSTNNDLIEEIDSDNVSSVTLKTFIQEHTSFVVEAVVDEKYVYFGSWDKTVRYYDLRCATGITKEFGRFTADDKVRALYVLQNFRKIIVGDSSGAIHILSKAPEFKLIKKIPKAHAADILAFAACEDVGLLFSVGVDKTIKAWDITHDYKLVKEIPNAHDDGIWGAAAMKSYLYTADGKGTIKCWSVPDLQPAESITSQQTSLRRLYYNSDRDWLVSCGSDCTAAVWDMKSCTLLKLIKLNAAVQCAVIVNDVLFCGTKGGYVEEYQITSGNDFVQIRSERYGPVWINCMAAYLNRVLCLGGGDYKLQFWHGKGVVAYKAPKADDDKLILNWTEYDVCTWAVDNGYSQYSEALVSNGVNGNLMFELTEYDVREDVGIKHIATRKKFMKDIVKLKGLYDQQKSDYIAPIAVDPSSLSGTVSCMHPHPMQWKHIHDKKWECSECGRSFEGNCFRCDQCTEDWCVHCFTGNPKYIYDVFLSHRQANGGDTCQSIKLQLENINPNLKIFLDVDDLNEVHNLKKLVRHTRVFLLLLTEGVLTRPFVQLEIRTALELKRKIVLVHDEKSCPFPSGPLLEGVPSDVLPVLNFKATPYIREKVLRKAAITQIYEHIVQPSS